MKTPMTTEARLFSRSLADYAAAMGVRREAAKLTGEERRKRFALARHYLWQARCNAEQIGAKTP